MSYTRYYMTEKAASALTKRASALAQAIAYTRGEELQDTSRSSCRIYIKDLLKKGVVIELELDNTTDGDRECNFSRGAVDDLEFTDNYSSSYACAGMRNHMTTVRPEPKASQKVKEKTTKAVEATKQVGVKMYDANKQAVKQVGYLNAGRAANKMTKEAIRPLIKLMFKPNWVQKLVLKVTKKPDPVDAFFESEYSDVVAAQLSQLLLEIKGVENQHVRDVAQAGIAYSMLQITDKIPLESTVDDVVAALVEGSEKIAKGFESK